MNSICKRRGAWWVAVALLAGLGSTSAAAHRAMAQSAPPFEQNVPKEPPLPPEQLSLRTSDGETLAVTWYPSRLGKEAVPLILLHAYRGSRGDLEPLARKLQQAGHAVLVPDLRGHGESTGPRGDLQPSDLAAMVRRDLETVKRFLIERNNAGDLNIERLGVVGVEMGASLAINWAALDWSWPVLASGKQGQDVKALAVIAPEWTFRGLRINEAMANAQVRSDLAFLIITPQNNSKLWQAARRLHNALARYHVDPPDDEAGEQRTLWLKSLRTSLQGTQLLAEQSLGIDDMILAFVDLRLVKGAMPWRARNNPLQAP